MNYIEIIQTYLKSENGDEIRVHQRGENGNYIYFKTIKKNIRIHHLQLYDRKV